MKLKIIRHIQANASSHSIGSMVMDKIISNGQYLHCVGLGEAMLPKSQQRKNDV